VVGVDELHIGQIARNVEDVGRQAQQGHAVAAPHGLRRRAGRGGHRGLVDGAELVGQRGARTRDRGQNRGGAGRGDPGPLPAVSDRSDPDAIQLRRLDLGQ
jgi:hypothetical protein